MIKINFFEKKKRNYAHHILISVFLIGLLLIGSYILIMSNHYVSEYEGNINKINQQQSLINEMQQIQSLSSTLNERLNNLEHLKENQYPTVFLYDEMIGLLPQLDRLPIRQYSFSIDEGVSLNLEIKGLNQVAELERKLSDLSFVTSVTLNSVGLVRESEQIYSVQFQVDIDRTKLSEVMKGD